MSRTASGHVKIAVDQLSDEVRNMLEDLNTEVAENVSEAAEKVAKDTVKTLKSTSPVRQDGMKRKYPPGSYAKSWGYEQTGEAMYRKEFTVRNKQHYQLTHLLEHGYIISKGKNAGKRSKVQEHIYPAEQDAIQEFTDEVKGMKL